MKPKKPNNPETAYLSAKEHYKETGDIRYVALAIGRTPQNPPQWAIKECQKLFLKSKRKDFSNFWVKNGPTPSDADYRLLNRMCTLIAKGKSINAAANAVVADDSHKATNVRRLVNQYNDEKQLNDQGIEESPRRLERAIVRRVKSGKWGKKE